MKKINSLDELDLIKLTDHNKQNAIELRYLKNCFKDSIFDTEWSDDATEGNLNYILGVGIELGEFEVHIYVEPSWDTELRGRLDFSNYMVLSIENRDGDDINPTQELADYIIYQIKKN